MASCSQWPGTQNDHWSAAVSFYACMLLNLVTIIMDSQQSSLLPNEKPHDADEDDFETYTTSDSKDRYIER